MSGERRRPSRCLHLAATPRRARWELAVEHRGKVPPRVAGGKGTEKCRKLFEQLYVVSFIPEREKSYSGCKKPRTRENRFVGVAAPELRSLCSCHMGAGASSANRRVDLIPAYRFRSVQECYDSDSEDLELGPLTSSHQPRWPAAMLTPTSLVHASHGSRTREPTERSTEVRRELERRLAEQTAIHHFLLTQLRRRQRQQDQGQASPSPTEVDSSPSTLVQESPPAAHHPRPEHRANDRSRTRSPPNPQHIESGSARRASA